MNMKVSLQLKLGQQLTMTPQLQQAIRLLQLSTLDLQNEIQEALESNPMLELQDDNNDPAASQNDNTENDKPAETQPSEANQQETANESAANEQSDADTPSEEWNDTIPEGLLRYQTYSETLFSVRL